jgi:hypothetical protein
MELIRANKTTLVLWLLFLITNKKYVHPQLLKNIELSINHGR